MGKTPRKLMEWQIGIGMCFLSVQWTWRDRLTERKMVHQSKKRVGVRRKESNPIALMPTKRFLTSSFFSPS